MLRRIIGAAVASAAAIGIAAVVKLMLDEENKEAENEEEENEVRFISIDDKEAEGSEPEAAPEPAPEAPAEETQYPNEVNEIAALYPYLDKAFIAEQFGRNAVFNEQYPEDSLITITHKAGFGSADALNDFIKIGEDNGYTAEVLGDTSATISRKIFTEDGAILSDIYNVANQVGCLKGEYLGYNIKL